MSKTTTCSFTLKVLRECFLFLSFLSRSELIYCNSSNTEHLQHPPTAGASLLPFQPLLFLVQPDLGYVALAVSALVSGMPFPRSVNVLLTHPAQACLRTLGLADTDCSRLVSPASFRLRGNAASFKNMVLFPNLLFWYLTEPIYLQDSTFCWTLPAEDSHIILWAGQNNCVI